MEPTVYRRRAGLPLTPAIREAAIRAVCAELRRAVAIAFGRGATSTELSDLIDARISMVTGRREPVDVEVTHPGSGRVRPGQP